MTAPPARCALDHTIPGRHLDDCPGGDCPGCQPALADPPTHACRWHTGRLTRSLGDIPDWVAHLHDMIEPGSGAGDERVSRGELAPPAPLRVDALAAADDLVRVVRSWAVRLAGERQLTGPQAARGAASRDRRTQDAQAIVTWLIAHTEDALRTRWAGAYITDICHEVGATRAAYPIEERPVWLPVPCPACGSNSLARWAPRWAGAPTTIMCELDDCRTVVDEQRYPWLVRLAADLARTSR